jgi:NAD-dependent deacetylase
MRETLRLEALQKAAGLIRASAFMVAFTGAGISTPSGIPDFRSAHTGLWEKDDPFEVASLTAFHRHPERFFNWLRPLARDLYQAAPNPAHLGLAQLEKAGLLKAIITQNIDGLHQKAGARNVIEVHGSMTRLDCLNCRRSYSTTEYADSFLMQGSIPRCSRCGNILKPTITLFEEMLPQKAWDQAERACRKADLVLVVGSSLEVVPAAYLPMHALDNHARLIINNLTRTPLDQRADARLPWDTAEAIPALVEKLQI